MSRSSSPVPIPNSRHSPLNIRKKFDPHASIVLVGVRGSGKSTLGVIAATSFRRRFVETEHVFQKLTTQTSSAYRKTHGLVQYQRRQAELLKTILQENDKDTVIVCGSGTLDNESQTLLREFAVTHPVINIVREFENGQQYFKNWQVEKISFLWRASGQMFRSCSNFEYFNLSEEIPESSEGDDIPGLPKPFLSLKRAQRHFVKFVGLALGADVTAAYTALPLSEVPVQSRQYTYMVVVPGSELKKDSTNIEELEYGADAFEIFIDPVDGRPPSPYRLIYSVVLNLSLSLDNLSSSATIKLRRARFLRN